MQNSKPSPAMLKQYMSNQGRRCNVSCCQQPKHITFTGLGMGRCSCRIGSHFLARKMGPRGTNSQSLPSISASFFHGILYAVFTTS